MAAAGAYDRLITGMGERTRMLLVAGAEYWSGTGPARIGADLVRFLRLDPSSDAARHPGRLADRLRAGEALPVADVTRVLFPAEIAMTSSVLGPADWCALHGDVLDPDGSTAREFIALRHAQDELLELGIPADGVSPFGDHAAGG